MADHPYNFESGLNSRERFRVEWDRQGRVWIRSDNDSDNLIVVKASDVEAFIQEVRRAAKGAPACTRCHGSGKEQPCWAP